MVELKNIAVKLALALLVLVGLNFVYEKTYYEKDLQAHSPEMIDSVRALPPRMDVLYVGESSNITTHWKDKDKRSIGQMVGSFYPDLVVEDLTKLAAHADVYHALLNSIPEETEIGTVVVTVNLRSFNTGWQNSKLETSLQKSMVMIRPYPPLVNRFFLSFKGYDHRTQEERAEEIRRHWQEDKLTLPTGSPYDNVHDWDYWVDVNGLKDSTGKEDRPRTILATHYIKAYGFHIDTATHRRIKDFDEIIELSKSRGWNLVLHLLPENTQRAQDLLGNELADIMEENRKILVKYFLDRGVTVVDNLNALENKYFVDQNWTSEHYDQEGRRIAAKNVAEALKQNYPEGFRD